MSRLRHSPKSFFFIFSTTKLFPPNLKTNFQVFTWLRNRDCLTMNRRIGWDWFVVDKVDPFIHLPATFRTQTNPHSLVPTPSLYFLIWRFCCCCCVRNLFPIASRTKPLGTRRSNFCGSTAWKKITTTRAPWKFVTLILNFTTFLARFLFKLYY